jgi:hypothetical protein
MAQRRRPTKDDAALRIVAQAAAGKRKAVHAPKRRANASPAVRATSKKQPKTPSVADIMKIVDGAFADFDFDADDPHDLGLPKYKNRYGLPKVKMFSTFDATKYGPAAVRWSRIATRYDEQLEDAMQAFEAGRISQAELERITKPIGVKFRHARAELDKAMNVAERGLKPRQPAKRTPTKRKRR